MDLFFMQNEVDVAEELKIVHRIHGTYGTDSIFTLVFQIPAEVWSFG